uniref:Uncharacterized protein n=1 Tax=Rhizophora mucronata TaxID=61149 RepID=A0A2P2QFC9_RHIMU
MLLKRQDKLSGNYGPMPTLKTLYIFQKNPTISINARPKHIYRHWFH